jgi:hypothetical protein
MNMNSIGDKHVSFTVLDVKVSPDGKFVLVQTGRFPAERLCIVCVRANAHCSNSLRSVCIMSVRMYVLCVYSCE